MRKDEISIRVAAEILGVHPRTLARWDDSGKLPAIRRGKDGRRRYKIKTIKNIVTNLKASSELRYRISDIRKYI